MAARHWLMAAALSLAPVIVQAQATPPIAPAYISNDLQAVGHVATHLPAPGAGVGVGGCSGTLIAPDLVLTAAHCAAPRAGRPSGLYITFGWRADGPPLWRSAAAEIWVDPDYVPGATTLETLRHDVAFVRLPRAVPDTLITPIPLIAGLRAEFYASYGYLAGADTLLRGHDRCRAELIAPALLGFDCAVVSGFSGGPLLVMGGDGPQVAAVAVAHLPGATGPIRSFAAIPPSDVATSR
ncbi:MAG: trypsin-like peptidase domain-containing protein [Pseudomonadota bacterium]